MATKIGPPSAGFPFGNLFIVLALTYSFIALYLNIGLGAYLGGLAFAVLIVMFVYVIFGAALASKGFVGQVLFIALGLGLAFFSTQLTSLLGIKISLVPLSVTSIPQVSFQINGADYTWLVPLVLVGFIYYLHRTGGLAEIKKAF